MNGIFNINKPSGYSSFEIVSLVKHLTGEKRCGHAGTLDPVASGVLPVCVGQATRIVEYLMDTPKTYLAEIEMGKSTDTGDIQGNIVKETVVPALDSQAINSVIINFTGVISQLPPIYSALKHKGRPLYYWARKGVAVEISPRQVVIHSIELLQWHSPLLTLRVNCGRGTYIRSLAADIGEQLGCGGYLKSLIREKHGPLNILDSVSPQQLEEAFRDGTQDMLLYSIDSVLTDMRAVILNEVDIKNIVDGKNVTISQSTERDGVSEYCRVYSQDGYFIAIMRLLPGSEEWHPVKVFNGN